MLVRDRFVIVEKSLRKQTIESEFLKADRNLLVAG